MIPTAADLAMVQGAIATMFGQALAVWRTPTPAPGSPTGPIAQVASISGAITPVDPMERFQLAAQGLTGGRYDAYGYAPAGVDIRAGDELRVGLQRYKVEGVAPWAVVTTIGLSRMADLAAAGNYLLLEDSSSLLLEDGSHLVLE